jgi:ferredoxin--NADP+ reductase
LYKILKKQSLADNIFLYEIKAPEIAQKAEAGQFVIIRIHEKGERIPLTIADYSREEKTITIIFQVVGKTTEELAKLDAEEEILDLVGPLGVPSEVGKYGTVVCVGGGVGIAPIYPIARALRKTGNKVISVIGARNSNLLFWREKMQSVSDELIIVTDDGSEGKKGFVTDALKEVIKVEKIAKVWAVGPMVMMRAVAEATRPFKIPTIVSLNPIMVDGTGMCGACRVSLGTETKFACVDGPEFDAHLVDFDLALKRLSFFTNEESRARQEGNCGGECGCH